MKEELERFIAHYADVGEAQDAVAEAEQLLVDYIKLEGRARRVVNSRRGPATGVADDSLAGLSVHEAARRVLEDEARPMHAKELGARMKARGWRHPRGQPAQPNQIVNSLAAQLPKRPAVFRRVAPQTFALVEWGDAATQRRPPKPRVGLFKGTGAGISGLIGDHPEAPIEAEHE